MDTDVLVVGAGPTGLMLADQLVRRGVRTVIIDRHPGPARETRALGVQARTLEIYAQLGIAARALELGKQGSGANLWARGRLMAHVPLGEAGRDITPYPYILVLGQDDNEMIMGEKLNQLGLSVTWNTELADFTQGADGVTATLKGPDGGTRSLTARCIAGCDGAHSKVRETCRIGFPGAPYEHVFFVADTESTGSMVADQVNVYLWRDGFHLLFPLRGQDHWRIVGILPEPLRGRDDVAFDDVIPSLRHEAGASLAIKSCSWFSTYRIHHRAAERFQEGRAFLLGDAAHIHSPVGAQGMNTGLQDAYNLAWKLSLVLQGRADEKLLDSYEAERLPVARRLLATTDRGFRLAVADGWLAGLIRTRIAARVAALAMRFPAIQRFAFRTVSQTAIAYPESPLAMTLAGLPKPAPRAGDRFPWLHLKLAKDGPPVDLFQALDDRHFHLLLFGQPAPDDVAALGFGNLLQVHAVPADAANTAALARVKLPPRAFYLNRPDGHVAICGTGFHAAAVRHYAETVLGLIGGG